MDTNEIKMFEQKMIDGAFEQKMVDSAFIDQCDCGNQ